MKCLHTNLFELVIAFRLANRRILELEGQIEDLHANQSAASIQEGTDLKQKLNSALKRQKETDLEIQNYTVTIESLESQIEVSGISCNLLLFFLKCPIDSLLFVCF